MSGRWPTERRSKAWRWIDLRLVPPAATIWVATLAAPMVPRQALAAAAAGAAVLAALLGVLVARHRPAPAAGVAVGVLAALAVTAALATFRFTARETSALHAAARAELPVTVELRLDSAFRQLSRSRAPRLLAEATVTGVDQIGGRLAVHDPVLLIADGNWPGVVPGETVRVRVQAAPPSPQDDVVAILSARGPPDPLAEPAWWQRGAAAIRAGLSDAAHRVLDDGPAGLLPGLVVGDTHALDPVLAENFRTAGLTHLVAVSGDDATIDVAGIQPRTGLSVAAKAAWVNRFCFESVQCFAREVWSCQAAGGPCGVTGSQGERDAG